jgi:hypothetical protein
VSQQLVYLLLVEAEAEILHHLVQTQPEALVLFIIYPGHQRYPPIFSLPAAAFKVPVALRPVPPPLEESDPVLLAMFLMPAVGAVPVVLALAAGAVAPVDTLRLVVLVVLVVLQ